MCCATKMSLTVRNYANRFTILVQLYNEIKAIDVGSEQVICNGAKKLHMHNANYWLYTLYKGIPLLKYLEHPS